MDTLKTLAVVNGKKLKASQVNLLAKLADKFGCTLADAPAIRDNPFTGKSHTLEPLAVTLFDFIVLNYRAGLVKGATVESLTNPKAIPTATWDSARHLFLAIWPDAYFDLID